MSIIRVFSPLPDSEKIYEIRVQDCQPLQFVNRFIGTSILTLGVAEANDAAHFLQEGCWLVTEDATPYIIMHRQQSENRVDVIAYSAHIGLDGRVTVPPAGEYAIESTGSADKVVKDFIRASLAELNRGLNITCAADQPGDEISDQSRYKPLGEEVVRVLTSAGRGERFTWGTSDITFDTYTGVDRSVSNTEENPVCIFAGRLKNLAGYTYKVDKTVEKTTPYVAGQGQGEEREIYVLGNDAAGWARREVFVDARDIEHGDLAKLQERGNQAKVPVGTQIVAEARDNVNLVYGADYNLGDIVTVQIPSRGFTKNASGFFEKVTDISSFDLRVTEVTITYDSGARTVDVAFGEVVRSQIARVANEVAQLKSTEAPPAAAIDLSNVEPSTIKQIVGTGLTMTGDLDVGGYDLKNYFPITSANGNDLSNYPTGFSYSIIDENNYVQNTGENFPNMYSTVYTVNVGLSRSFQWCHANNYDSTTWFRAHYNGFRSWQRTNDRFPKMLWSGSWSSGTLTVPGSDTYMVFIVVLNTLSLIAVKNGTGGNIRGVTGFWYDTSSYQGTPLFDATYNGETWTFRAANRIYHIPSGSHSTVTDLTVTAIYGLH